MIANKTSRRRSLFSTGRRSLLINIAKRMIVVLKQKQRTAAGGLSQFCGAVPAFFPDFIGET